jgi:hypothetical protein
MISMVADKISRDLIKRFSLQGEKRQIIVFTYVPNFISKRLASVDTTQDYVRCFINPNHR